MLKVTLDTYLPLTTKIVNLSLKNGCFPDNLKLSEVIFHKNNKTNKQAKLKNNDVDKENYRLVSVLLNVSKVFERIIYTQVDAFMQDKPSNLLAGFRKNHSTQNCLMYILKI